MKVGDTISDTSGVQYRLDYEYVQGAQAMAYRAFRINDQLNDQSSDPLVIKMYLKPESDRRERIEKIIQTGKMIQTGLPERTLCFPFSFIQCNGFDGVVMPHTPMDSIAMSHDDLFVPPFDIAACPKLLDALCSGSIKYKTMYLNAFHLARAIDKLYRFGFAHCDFSFNNVFINLETGQASVIDLDNLAVREFLTTNIKGTPGFIAPELEIGTKQQPDHETDAHSLAVLVFYLLMSRHPLVGSKMNLDFATDPFGRNALFTDHPKNTRNRFLSGGIEFNDLPDSIRELFLKAFVDGLHDPSKRPSATRWINPLWAAIDAMVVCRRCGQTTPVQAVTHSSPNALAKKCIFCGNELQGPLFVLKFTSGQVKVIEEGSRLYPHHLNGDTHQYDFSHVLADCKKHQTGEVILANRNSAPITAHFQSGQSKTITQQQGFSLRHAKRIEFNHRVSATVEVLTI